MANKGERFLAKSFVSGMSDQMVIFEGIQKVGFEGYPDFSIYTLTQSIDMHPKGSTLSRETLLDCGFILESKAP